MNKNPTVSIIIPTYNRAHLVSRSIQSVLNQTYQDFELIIVNDGSTDNTKEVIRKYQEKDKRIKYIRHEKNRGGSAARNTGIKAAKGEYIAFQDSDDEWLPQKLEKQIKVLKSILPKIVVIYTGFWRIENNKKYYIPSERVVQKEGSIYEELLKGNFVTTQSIVAHRECFEKVGMFDESLPRLQDWELVLKLSKYYNFKYIDEPLLISYFTPDSISINREALIKAYEIILTKHFSNLNKNKRILSMHYYNIGSNLYLAGHLKKGRKYFIKAIKIYPADIRYLLKYILSFFGQKTYNKIIKLFRMFKKYNYRGIPHW